MSDFEYGGIVLALAINPWLTCVERFSMLGKLHRGVLTRIMQFVKKAKISKESCFSDLD